MLKSLDYLHKVKISNEQFLLYVKNQDFSTSISETSKSVYFYFMIDFLWSSYLLELGRSKVLEKNMSYERALNFDQ